MGNKIIDKENRRELQALDDEQLNMVAGGTGTVEETETNYLCLKCGAQWTSIVECSACMFCGSEKIASGEAAKI